MRIALAALIAAFAFALAGCSTHPITADGYQDGFTWYTTARQPAKDVDVRVVKMLPASCAAGAHSCAVINGDRCEIFMLYEDRAQEIHEGAHCAGRDHREEHLRRKSSLNMQALR